ncbi:MAG: glycosyltransferase [Bacteroidales bacterium]|nr:glycosyltransferase [Bacteroidales bacterium]
MTRYPDITLRTYGIFPSAEIKESIMKYHCLKISVGEVITGKEKFAVIESADCLILPSHNEGEPLVLLEAMSVGTPVISTNVGMIPEMLGKGYPFIFSPGDQTSLEEKIVQFINFGERLNLSERLKERYSSLYSNTVHSLHLNSIFN